MKIILIGISLLFFLGTHRVLAENIFYYSRIPFTGKDTAGNSVAIPIKSLMRYSGPISYQGKVYMSFDVKDSQNHVVKVLTPQGSQYISQIPRDPWEESRYDINWNQRGRLNDNDHQKIIERKQKYKTPEYTNPYKVNYETSNGRTLPMVYETRQNPNRYQNQAKGRQPDCSPVNLASQFPPVKDQDGVGWCFAFAASDLASFYTGDNVSSSDTAMEYYDGYQNLNDYRMSGKNTRTYLSRNEGGNFELAFDTLLKKGYCLETEVSSEENAGTRSYAIDEKIAKFESAFDRLKGSQLQKKIQTRKINACEVTPQIPGPNIFGNLPCEAFQRALSLNSSKAALNSLRKSACPRRRPLRVPGTPYVRSVGRRLTGKNLVQVIQNSLSRGKPVGITMDVNPLIKASDRKANGLHSMTAIGRRYNETTKKCDYLMRNSWGRSCRHFKSSLVNNCTSDGNVWISEEDLSANITDTLSIE